jgi:hypothetical protein
MLKYIVVCHDSILFDSESLLLCKSFILGKLKEHPRHFEMQIYKVI